MGRVGNLDPHSPRVQGRRETATAPMCLRHPSIPPARLLPAAVSLRQKPPLLLLRRISAQENNGATEDTLAGKNEGIQVKEEEEEEKSSEVDAEIREKSAARKERSKMEELVEAWRRRSGRSSGRSLERFGRPLGRQGLNGYLPLCCGRPYSRPDPGRHLGRLDLGGHLPPREGGREAATPSGWAPSPVDQRPCLASAAPTSSAAALAGHSSPRGRSGAGLAMVENDDGRPGDGGG
ncbi:hypothetical protein KSP40_PGU007464 [Platanthera guangdongensis]|uniref:Uncharacterized protein n=1 Tax=Platanthera guangdongensis TaxID=2320717 RepID=A0ABR2LXL4_9ASPA